MRRGPLVLVVTVAVCVAVAILVATGVVGPWSSSSSTQRMAGEFDDLRLGDAFELAASESAGSSDCLGGDCLRLDQYYISDLTVSQACDAARRALTSWGDIRDDPSGAPEGAGVACAFSGQRDGYEVIAQVRADMMVESPNIIGEQPIGTPHTSVVFVELVDVRANS